MDPFTPSQKRICKLATKYGLNRKNPLFEESYETCQYCKKTFSSKLEALIHNKKHLFVSLKHFSLRKESVSKLHGDFDQSKDLMIELPTQPSSGAPEHTCSKEDKVLGNLIADCKVNLEPMICDDDHRHFEMALAQLKALKGRRRRATEDPKSSEPPPNILSSLTNVCKVMLDDPLFGVSAPQDVPELVKTSVTMESSFNEDLEVPQIDKVYPTEPQLLSSNKPASTSLLQPTANTSYHQLNGNMAEPSQMFGPSQMVELSDDDDRPPVNNIMDMNDYDSLIRPLICYCPLCPEVFPNRFEYYKHKVTHLRVKLKCHLRRPSPVLSDSAYTFVKYTSHCAFCQLKFPSIFELIRHLAIHIKNGKITAEEFSACHSMRKTCNDCLYLEANKPKVVGEVYFERNVSCTICNKRCRSLNLYPKPVIATKGPKVIQETVTGTASVIDLSDDEPEQGHSRAENPKSANRNSSLIEKANPDMELMTWNSESKLSETRNYCNKLIEKLVKANGKRQQNQTDLSGPKKASGCKRRKTQRIRCAFCKLSLKSILCLTDHLVIHIKERRIPPHSNVTVYGQTVYKACRKCYKSMALPRRVIGELYGETLCSMCGRTNAPLVLHRLEIEQPSLSITEQKEREVEDVVHCAFCKLRFNFVSELIEHLAIHVKEGKIEPKWHDGRVNNTVYMACKSCYELMATPPYVMGELKWEARCSLCSKSSSHFHLYSDMVMQKKPMIIDLCEEELDENVQDQSKSKAVTSQVQADSISIQDCGNSDTTPHNTNSIIDLAESRNPILISLLDGSQTATNESNSNRIAKPRRTAIHCALCDEKFYRVIELSRHMSVHAREGKLALENDLASQCVYKPCERCHELASMSPTELGKHGEVRCSTCTKLDPDSNFDPEMSHSSITTGNASLDRENLGFGIDKWLQEQANASFTQEYEYPDLGSLILDSENASLTRICPDPTEPDQNHVNSNMQCRSQVDFEAEIAALNPVQASFNINNIHVLWDQNISTPTRAQAKPSNEVVTSSNINNIHVLWDQNISTPTRAQAKPSNEVVTLRKITAFDEHSSQSIGNSYINTVWEHPNSSKQSGAFISEPLNSMKQSGIYISEPTTSNVRNSDSEDADPNWIVPGSVRSTQGRERGRSCGRGRGRPRGRPRGTRGFDRGTRGFDRGTRGFDRGTHGFDRGTHGFNRVTRGSKQGKILSIKERIAFEDDLVETTSSPVEKYTEWREYTGHKKTNAMRLINIQKRLKELRRH